MDDINFIKPQNSLRQKEKKDKIKTAIKARITSITNYHTLRTGGLIDQELILMVCNCVENLVKKKYGIDKKSFVVEIMSELFPGLSQLEREHVANACQFLFDNLLIQMVPILEKSKYIVWSWIKRKVG